MKTKFWIGIPLLVVSLAAVVVVLVIASRSNQQTSTMAAQNQIYNDLVQSVSDFHKDMGMISPSATSMQDQLRRVKDTSASNRDKIKRISQRSFVSTGGNIDLLKRAIEKTDMYMSAYDDFANIKIEKNVIEARTTEMNQACQAYCQKSGSTTGVPDSGDCIKILSLTAKVVTKYKDNKKAVTDTTMPAETTGYWANPSYQSYYNATKRIVVNYNKGRNILSRILNHYDAGMMTDYDRSQWRSELARRQQLLNEIDASYSMIPSGSIYEKHHVLLRQMVENGIAAMQSFGNYESTSNRINLTAVSSRNTRIMAQLKAFYRVR